MEIGLETYHNDVIGRINNEIGCDLLSKSIGDSTCIVSKGEIREGLMNLEDRIREMENSFVGDTDNCPLKHSFSDGIYVREIFIPKGTLLTGKIHKHEHPNFLMSGEVLVVTENNGRELLKAPLSIISPSGTKRALYTLTDVVLITTHFNPTNTQDLEELEKIAVASSYDEYEKFIESKKSTLSKLKNLIIKNLSL